MTTACVRTVREMVQVARMASVNMGEDTGCLDFLLDLPDGALMREVSLDDALEVYSMVPAYFRR